MRVPGEVIVLACTGMNEILCIVSPAHSIDSYTVDAVEGLWHICKMYYPHGRDKPGSREPDVSAVVKVTPPFDFQYFIPSTPQSYRSDYKGLLSL